MTRGIWLVAVGLGVTACSLDGLLKSDELPSGVTDPTITRTPAGALAAYHGTVAQFRNAFGVAGGGNAAAAMALLTDELKYSGDGSTTGGNQIDRRTLPDGHSYDTDNVYSLLQKVRGQAGQATGLLARYRPEEPALEGHMYAMEGYAEVFLAELFCSGIPLSTLDFGGDFTYRPGSTTTEVFTHAVALFDTALALAGDSARVLDLARVGQARAFLGLGEYAQAAAVAAPVPDDYRYTLSFTATADTTAANAPNFARLSSSGTWEFSVADREGGNGLDYRSSDDPRLRFSNVGTGANAAWHPDQYADDGSSPIVLASGVEARLIEAEAALQAGDIATWLTKLNALRTDGTQDGSGTDNPGTGGVAGLAPLSDPGSDVARVDLLFRERAFWLFLTGHRQGDLRRLIRQYDRRQDQVYPTGTFESGGAPSGIYGNDVTAPIPESEQLFNPQFTGCASRRD